MKKALIILLAILAVAGMFVGCNSYEDKLVDKLRDQVEWYDHSTRIEIVHVYRNVYVLTAAHTYEDGLVGIDVWKTYYSNVTKEYELTCIYNGGQIN